MSEDHENDVAYWRNKAEETERELEDFRESSQMLEKELENSLEQSDKTIKELRLKNNALLLENDTLKDKYDDLQRATEAHISELEEETEQWHKREEDYVKCIRELEQKNDDLERSQRALFTSLAEFETKLNNALERNVFLESELDEKESLKAMVQRLKDEARDLKQEIHVRNKPEPEKNRIVDSNKIEGSDPPPSPGHMPPLKSLSNGMAPPSRISAMNIVGDLLRRVGLERLLCARCDRIKCTCSTPILSAFQ
uniref:Nuclear distribution protein nudE 1-A n=1 Tax=Lygus hesperus TaxID=30085 RepID=A0A0A9XPK0_LYGHE